MNHLKLAAMLLLTVSTTFASDRLPYDGKLTEKRLALSDKGHVGYTHNPYPSMYTTNASRIKAIANKTSRKFPNNIPTEFPVLLKILEKMSPENENNKGLEDVKNYIKSYLPDTAIERCNILTPTNEQEETAAIKQLQESLQVLSNVKSILTEPNDEYKRATQNVYNAIIKFVYGEYFRLQKLKPSEQTAMTQYNQIISFFEGLDLSLFETKRSEKIKCYYVTMLLGGANIAGMLRDNYKQLDLAQQAEELINSMISDIKEAYLNGNSFIRSSVKHTCLKIISRAKSFLKRDFHQGNLR